jgi:hypothetical protein
MFPRLLALLVVVSSVGQPLAASAESELDKLRRQNSIVTRTGPSFPPDHAKRVVAMAKLGGKENAEIAVLAGLRWFKQHQNDDGSWSDEYRPSMTGFALLCFLGHDELTTSPEFGPTVQKAIDWLYFKGTEFDGRLSMARDGWGGGNSGVYEHAIATYALAEYYRLTKEERIGTLLKKAADYMVAGQAPDGGWQYGYAKGPGSDTSVSGWQIQALRAAHRAGIAGLDGALDGAMLNLRRVQNESGNFGYRQAGDRSHPSLAGVGTYCLSAWKQDKDRSVRDGIYYLLKMTEKYPVKYQGDCADLYAWYYNTKACMLYGGDAWAKWNRLFQDEIWRNQKPDGSWPPVNSKAPGGELQRKGDGAGPYFRTSLCILMLQVLYGSVPR